MEIEKIVKYAEFALAQKNYEVLVFATNVTNSLADNIARGNVKAIGSHITSECVQIIKKIDSGLKTPLKIALRQNITDIAIATGER